MHKAATHTISRGNVAVPPAQSSSCGLDRSLGHSKTASHHHQPPPLINPTGHLWTLKGPHARSVLHLHVPPFATLPHTHTLKKASTLGPSSAKSFPSFATLKRQATHLTPPAIIQLTIRGYRGYRGYRGFKRVGMNLCN